MLRRPRHARIGFLTATLLGLEAATDQGFHFFARARVSDADRKGLAFLRRIFRIVLFHLFLRNFSHRLFDRNIDILAILHNDDYRVNGFVTRLVAVDTLDHILTLFKALERQGVLFQAINRPSHLHEVGANDLTLDRRNNFDLGSRLVEHDKHGLGCRIAILVFVGVGNLIAGIPFGVLHQRALFVYEVGHHHGIARRVLVFVGHGERPGLHLFTFGSRFRHQPTRGILNQFGTGRSVCQIGNRHSLSVDFRFVGNGDDFDRFFLALVVHDLLLDDFAVIVGRVAHGHIDTCNLCRIRHLDFGPVHRRRLFVLRIFVEGHGLLRHGGQCFVSLTGHRQCFQIQLDRIAFLKKCLSTPSVLQ